MRACPRIRPKLDSAVGQDQFGFPQVHIVFEGGGPQPGIVDGVAAQRFFLWLFHQLKWKVDAPWLESNFAAASRTAQ